MLNNQYLPLYTGDIDGRNWLTNRGPTTEEEGSAEQDGKPVLSC